MGLGTLIAAARFPAPLVHRSLSPRSERTNWESARRIVIDVESTGRVRMRARMLKESARPTDCYNALTAADDCSPDRNQLTKSSFRAGAENQHARRVRSQIARRHTRRTMMRFQILSARTHALRQPTPMNTGAIRGC